MANNVWKGASGASWNTASNWSLGFVGSANGDTAQVNGGANIAASGALNEEDLLFAGSGTVTITGSFSFSVSTSFTIDAGVTLSLPASTAVTLTSDIVMSGAGTATLSGGAYSSDNDVTVPSGSTLIFAGASVSVDDTSGSGTITLNGTSLTLKSSSAPSATINFAGVAGGGTPNVLKVPSYANSLKVTGFGYGDAINNGGDSLTLVATGNSIGGASVYNIKDGNTTIGMATLSPSSDGYSGAAAGDTITLINNGGNNTYPCFYPGTMLATADGEIAVEDVKAGMLLKTMSGALKPVRWVGWSDVSTVFADPLRVLPVRIQAGALAEGVPARDLLVSPDHAVLVEGVLAQAGALINGTSIFREADVPTSFRYYHVELDEHELLIADGCPAESFVDNIERMNFQNWDEREAPAETVSEMSYPRAKSARQLPSGLRPAVARRARLFEKPDAA